VHDYTEITPARQGRPAPDQRRRRPRFRKFRAIGGEIWSPGATEHRTALGQNLSVAPYPRDDTSAGTTGDLPTWRKQPFDDPEWLFDFKYDSFRALCYLEWGRCRFISRNGNVLSRFEALGDQLAAVLLGVDDAVIDGEVISPDETGNFSFTTSSAAHARPPSLCRPALFPASRAPEAAASDCGAEVINRPEALSVTGRGRDLFNKCVRTTWKASWRSA
jgi:hypothetical protein